MGLGFLCIQVNPCHLRPCAQSWKGGSLRSGTIFHTLILRDSEDPVPYPLASGPLDCFISTIISLTLTPPPPSYPRELGPSAASEAADDQCSSLLPRTSALPPLDWPLPSQYEQLELRIEVQPRAHHRAHYETEGSRGAVKAAPGGHPVVKVRGRDQA